MIDINIELLDPECKPLMMNKGDACFDLKARESIEIPPGETVMVPVGVKSEIPIGYHAAVSARSGMGKRGILVANAPGIIDSYYRNEWCVLLYNSKRTIFKIDKYSRIAQFRIVKNIEVGFNFVEKVATKNDRGGGFGSTGF